MEHEMNQSPATHNAPQTGFDPFSHQTYTVRSDFLNFWHRKFRILDPSDKMVLYVEMKALKLKEDIRVYSDDTKSKEIMLIKARQMLDISAAYDVVDAATGQKVGALKRAGLKSTFIRDEWSILDVNDQPFGKIEEDSMVMALIRRFLVKIIPQGFTVEVNGQPIAEFKQSWNPFVLKLMLDFSGDPNFTLDRRLGIAAAILLNAIEGRQE